MPQLRQLTIECLLDHAGAFSQLLLERNEHGQFTIIPLLHELTVIVTSVGVGWVETLVDVRNGGQPEAHGMPFILHLPRTWAIQSRQRWNITGFEDVRSRHPWSIVDKKPLRAVRRTKQR